MKRSNSDLIVQNNELMRENSELRQTIRQQVKTCETLRQIIEKLEEKN